jgi:hypothetical protein
VRINYIPQQCELAESDAALIAPRERCHSIASPFTVNFLSYNCSNSLPAVTASFTSMAEINIDKNLFQERLSHFYSAWKADKRSGDALFGGASSILVLMGKSEESVQFQKNNALHVCIIASICRRDER